MPDIDLVTIAIWLSHKWLWVLLLNTLIAVIGILYWGHNLLGRRRTLLGIVTQSFATAIVGLPLGAGSGIAGLPIALVIRPDVSANMRVHMNIFTFLQLLLHPEPSKFIDYLLRSFQLGLFFGPLLGLIVGLCAGLLLNPRYEPVKRDNTFNFADLLTTSPNILTGWSLLSLGLELSLLLVFGLVQGIIFTFVFVIIVFLLLRFGPGHQIGTSFKENALQLSGRNIAMYVIIVFSIAFITTFFVRNLILNADIFLSLFLILACGLFFFILNPYISHLQSLPPLKASGEHNQIIRPSVKKRFVQGYKTGFIGVLLAFGLLYGVPLAFATGMIYGAAIGIIIGMLFLVSGFLFGIIFGLLSGSAAGLGVYLLFHIENAPSKLLEFIGIVLSIIGIVGGLIFTILSLSNG